MKVKNRDRTLAIFSGMGGVWLTEALHHPEVRILCIIMGVVSIGAAAVLSKTWRLT